MKDHVAPLYFGSKKISLMVLAVTAIITSRLLFIFFDDPEGPNLLIVTGMAMGIYLISLAVYLFAPFSVKGIKRLLAVIGVQLVMVIGLYFCMR